MNPVVKSFSAIMIAATMLFAGTVSAQSNGNPSIPRVAAAANDSGAWAGLLDEFNDALQADYLYLRKGAATNTLAFSGPFTVFAPSNGAFKALKQTLACNGLTMADVPDIVRTTLFSHATSGRLYAADVVAASEVTMASGVTFMQSGGVITDAVGQKANILVTDIEASNGVIHIIDTVLLPVDLGLSACGS